MNCLDGMKLIQSNSVDLIITDPPFAINFSTQKRNYNRRDDNIIQGYEEIKHEKYYDFTYRWMIEAFRVLKKSGNMYVFSGWNNLNDILTALTTVGFITVNHIIWKYQFGVVTKNKFVTSHYHCLYVCKNSRYRQFFSHARYNKNTKSKDGKSLHYMDKEDVWNIKREYWINKLKTPTKLPFELIKKILEYSSVKHNIVLDPFLGSGQVAVVSKMLNRHYLGFEIVKDYYKFAKTRLHEINIKKNFQNINNH